MPDQTFDLRRGSFRARVSVVKLAELPVTRTRKLFKLSQEDDRNSLEIAQLGQTLKDLYQDAERELAVAKCRLAGEYRDVPDRTKYPSHIRARKCNRELERTVKTAHARLKAIERVQKIYKDVFGVSP